MSGPDDADYFATLELPRQFDIAADLLRRNYLQSSRRVHPDRLGVPPDAEALRRAARVNEAHRVLADAVLRAEYLLELAGGPSAADDKRVPPEVLAETLERREQFDELQSSNDAAGLASLVAEIENDRAARWSTVEALARQLPGNSALHSQLRLGLNALRYQTRLLEQMRGKQEI